MNHRAEPHIGNKDEVTRPGMAAASTVLYNGIIELESDTIKVRDKASENWTPSKFK